MPPKSLYHSVWSPCSISNKPNPDRYSRAIGGPGLLFSSKPATCEKVEAAMATPTTIATKEPGRADLDLRKCSFDLWFLWS